MKQLFCIVLIFCAACNGRLTDEQRKRLKDGMKRNEIKKVSDAQLTDAAFALGRLITSGLRRSVDQHQIDSLQIAYAVDIKALYPGKAAKRIEREVMEAYAEGAGKVKLSDNVQKSGTDSLFYTLPVTRELPDGSQEFNFAWGVRMAKREVVNSIRD